MYLDSHCHLDPDVYGSDADVDAVVERARAAGVSRMISIGSGYGAPSLRKAVAVAERHPDVWCAVGLHPHDAALWDDAFAADLAEVARHPRVVGLGEMGLDFHYDKSPRDVQRACLRAQVKLALELDLPIIIHDREAGDETLDIVRESGGFDGAGALWHCFTGDRALLAKILDAGGIVSIPGIVTFKNAAEMQAVARECPLDRMLVETDSPFLTPIPFRGQRNEPMRVPLVAAKIAELRGIPVDDVAAATTANSVRFFRLDTR